MAAASGAAASSAVDPLARSGGKRFAPREQNITVAVRIRPLSQKEVLRGAFACLETDGSHKIECVDPDDKQLESLGGNKVTDFLRLDKTKDRDYYFDHALGPTASQDETFERTGIASIVPDVLSGKNSCVFAYGATGSGKTFTMTGSQESPGLIPLAVDTLFAAAGRDGVEVTMQYVEIYNETIKDLLQPSNTNLDVREAPGRGTWVAGAATVEVSSREDVEMLLDAGNAYRTTESTQLNMVSSRSHAVLQLKVAVGADLRGKLSLIDLAGSERASKTGVMNKGGTMKTGGTQNNSKRLNEGANINRSLLALANCISALADQAKRGSGATGSTHVPYRDSKLTRLLKDSLGGHCKTMMIANVSPASDQFDETLNTLKYADRAKRIRTKEAKSMKNSSRRRLLPIPQAQDKGGGSAAAAAAAVSRAAERSAAAQKEYEKAANVKHLERMQAGRLRGNGNQVPGGAVWNRNERPLLLEEPGSESKGGGNGGGTGGHNGGGVAARKQAALARLNGGGGGGGPRMVLTRQDSAALTVQRHARGRLARAKTQKLQVGDFLAMQGAGEARRRQALKQRAALSQAAGDVPALSPTRQNVHRPARPQACGGGLNNHHSTAAGGGVSAARHARAGGGGVQAAAHHPRAPGRVRPPPSSSSSGSKAEGGVLLASATPSKAAAAAAAEARMMEARPTPPPPATSARPAAAAASLPRDAKLPQEV